MKKSVYNKHFGEAVDKLSKNRLAQILKAKSTVQMLEIAYLEGLMTRNQYQERVREYEKVYKELKEFFEDFFKESEPEDLVF